MKVLVTGARGFLGRYVIASLKRRGIETVAVGRPPRDGLEDPAFISADLLSDWNAAEIIRASGASHLIHLAWYTEHGKYWSSRLNLDWVGATVRLVEAFCEGGGQHITAAGTCAEYDWAQGYCHEATTALTPRSLYGVAKDATRRLVTAVCEQYGARFAWGRIFIPFGAGESSERLVPALIGVFSGTKQPFGVDADAVRDFLHASDVAEGLVMLLLSGVHGAYNVSSGQPVQIKQVVETLANRFNIDPHLVLRLYRERSDEPALLVGDNANLKSLGWEPQLSLNAGLSRTLADLGIRSSDPNLRAQGRIANETLPNL
ncbi:MAG: NAD(P)-dependent oxidoreductase [Acidobacteria bacterium]|nr:MAG: NAD(P)-dependent oxidoreductase [Acidobacteriota bacterium]